MKSKLVELQGKLGEAAIIVRDFSTPLSVIDGTSRKLVRI